MRVSPTTTVHTPEPRTLEQAPESSAAAAHRTGAAPPTTQTQPPWDGERARAAVERLNRLAAALGTSLQFRIHEDTHQVMVKVVDADGQVIREIPPEKALDAFAKMQEILGLLVDEKL